jgi:hypothetical protein
MFQFKPPHLVPHLVCVTALTITSLVGVAAQAQALNHGRYSEVNPIVFSAPANPPNQGAPNGRRQGGASRGPCQNYSGLTALTPEMQGKVWSMTASDRPTFWFYLPTSTASNSTVEFVLQDSEDQYIYQTVLNPPDDQSGVVSVSIPSNASALEIDKTYYWTFSVQCDAAHPSSAVFVRGSIYRTAISADLQRQIATASPLEKVSLYAANGIWQEALTLLANLRRTDPQNSVLTTAWTNLLEQAELDAIVPSPLISCCSPEVSVSNSALRY